MKIRSFALSLIVTAFIGTVCAYAATPPGFNKDTRQYTVVEGDTLWDLSGVFYQNPWFWPRIWYANPPIKNPHLIYPGQVISLPEVLAGTAPVPVVQTTAPQPISMAAESATETVQPSVAVAAVTTVAPLTTVVVEEDMPYQPPLSEEEIPFRTEQEKDVESRLDIGALKTRKKPLPTQIIQQIGNEEFLVKKDELEGDAHFLRADRLGTLFAEGDYFWINLGDGEARMGEKYIVARRQREISSTRTDLSLGYLMHPTGIVKVVQVIKDASRVIVTKSFDAIEISNVLFEPADLSLEIAAAPASTEIHGEVVAMPDDSVLAAAWQRVFMDVGDKQGVKRGDILTLYRERGEVDDKQHGREVKLPNQIIGSLVVVSTGENGSTGLILESDDDVTIGDRVATPGL